MHHTDTLIDFFNWPFLPELLLVSYWLDALSVAKPTVTKQKRQHQPHPNVDNSSVAKPKSINTKSDFRHF